MARTPSKDIYDLLEILDEQAHYQKELRLDSFKRESFMNINGLGSSLQQRYKEKQKLMEDLKQQGRW